METIALVAHNEKKSILLEWAKINKEYLLKNKLIGTSNTAKLINSVLDLEIEPFGHGPNGGDILLAAKILQREVDKVIFLIDAENPHGHEHVIQTLIRTCVINNIPIALNLTTAYYLIAN